MQAFETPGGRVTEPDRVCGQRARKATRAHIVPDVCHQPPDQRALPCDTDEQSGLTRVRNATCPTRVTSRALKCPLKTGGSFALTFRLGPAIVLDVSLGKEE